VSLEISDQRGTVTVTEETVTRQDGTVVVNRYVVTSSSGYRANLPACSADRCLSGEVKPCTTPTGDRGQHSVSGKSSVNAWLAHSVDHCHGWHAPTVERFARDVLKSFQCWRPRPATLPGVTPYMRNGSVLVDCPAWPVVDDLPTTLPEPCNCESCKATLALVGAR
jgi:hypothetical protein